MNADERKKLRNALWESFGDELTYWTHTEGLTISDGDGEALLTYCRDAATEDAADAEQACRTVSTGLNALPELLDDIDRLEAENAALKDRVAALEEVREKAAKLSGASIVEDLQPHWAALRAALDRAGEGK